MMTSETTATFDLDAALDAALARVREQEREQVEAREKEAREKKERAIAEWREQVEQKLPADLLQALHTTYDYDAHYDLAQAQFTVGDDRSHWYFWSNGWEWVLRDPNGSSTSLHVQLASPALSDWILQQIAQWRETATAAQEREQAERAATARQTPETREPRVIAESRTGVFVQLDVEAHSYGDISQTSVHIDRYGGVVFHHINTAEATYDGSGDENGYRSVARRFSLNAKQTAAFVAAYQERMAKIREADAQQNSDDSNEPPF